MAIYFNRICIIVHIIATCIGFGIAHSISTFSTVVREYNIGVVLNSMLILCLLLVQECEFEINTRALRMIRWVLCFEFTSPILFVYLRLCTLQSDQWLIWVFFFSLTLPALLTFIEIFISSLIYFIYII
jgi:hypothetical protein